MLKKELEVALEEANRKIEILEKDLENSNKCSHSHSINASKYKAALLGIQEIANRGSLFFPKKELLQVLSLWK